MEDNRCPHLGLHNDPDTALAFPSERNCCHHADPVEPINFEHQSSHCFTAAHAHCPVFLRSIKEPLPVDLQIISPSQGRRGIAIGGIVSALIVVALIILLLARGEGAGANVWPWPSEAEATQTQLTNPTAILPSPSPAPIKPSDTIDPVEQVEHPQEEQPSATPQPTVTLCPPPEGWITITVKEGDTLESLAERYGIAPRKLMQANCLGNRNLISGTAFFVPAPTQQAAPTQEATATSQPVTCGSPPAGWVLYTVQPGDTLYHIGLAHGVTVAQLQSANCLASTTIRSGQTLYVPNVPTVTVWSTRTATSTEELEPSATFSPEPTDTPLPTATPTTQPTDTPFPTDTPTDEPPPPPPTETSTPIPLPPSPTPEK
jgi:LysM repeat protein